MSFSGSQPSDISDISDDDYEEKREGLFLFMLSIVMFKHQLKSVFSGSKSSVHSDSQF